MYNGNKAAPASHNVFNWVSNYATNAIIASIGLRVHGRRDPMYVTQILREAPQLYRPRRSVIYNITELAMLVKMHAVGIVLANGPTRYYVRTGFKNRIENWNQLTEGHFISRN